METNNQSSSNDSDQYCLRWSEYQSSITRAFSLIRDEEDLFDVSLVASDGRSIKAHKLVLSACSPLFKTMLKTSSHPQPLIFLSSVSFDDLYFIVQFMYCGYVSVSHERIDKFLTAAKELRILGLSTFLKDRRAAGGVSSSDSSPPKTESSQPGSKRLKEDHPSSPRSDDCAYGSVKFEPRDVVVTPDVPSVMNYRTDDRGGGEDERSSSSGDYYRDNYHLRNSVEDALQAGIDRGVLSAIGSNFTLHHLGGRDGDDPLARVTVAYSAKGWHCPQCLHTSTTKGNLKAHILSGRHKHAEKSFVCHYCHKNYSTRQSLQVHISTNHRRKYSDVGEDQYHSRQTYLHQGDHSRSSHDRGVVNPFEGSGMYDYHQQRHHDSAKSGEVSGGNHSSETSNVPPPSANNMFQNST